MKIDMKKCIKNPFFWIICIGIIICIIFSIGLMAKPKIELKNVSKIEIQEMDTIVEITDEETIKRITDCVNRMYFVPSGISIGTGGWSYRIFWYDENGNQMEYMMVLDDDTISEDVFFFKSLNESFETEFFDELLEEERMKEE